MPASPSFKKDRFPYLRSAAVILLATALAAALGRGLTAALIGTAVGCVPVVALWVLRSAEAGPVHIALDREDFGRLVRGQQVTQPGLRIILCDIGFPAMAAELVDAQAESLLAANDDGGDGA